jgi:RNA polymerase sigma-70 factor, ECF subfamily
MARVDPHQWPNDDELVELCRSGQNHAFQALVERYQDRVYNVVYRMVNHEEDARDAVQETFLKAYEHLGRFRGESAFYTWLFRIAMNEALNHRRAKQRLRLVQPAEDVEAASTGRNQAAGLSDSPQRTLETLETERMVAEAIAELDCEHRAAVVLRDIEGLDYGQISVVLSIPPGTVKSRIHRARLILKEKLQKAMVQ